MWVTYKTHRAGCIALPFQDEDWARGVTTNGATDYAKVVAWVKKRATEASGGEAPLTIDSLPYDAHPILNLSDFDSPPWTLCYSPETCKGKSSCPKSRACSE